jgi:hypothetical protein
MPITTGGLVNYNQKFIDTAEHIDTFIQNRVRRHPQIWMDRIPKGALTMFEGLVRTTNIFHGGLGEQAGLTNWDRMQISRKPSATDSGFDACAYDPKTFDYAVETRQYTGYRSSWQSEPICVSDIVYVEQGRQQAALITSFLPRITMSVWENWNREQYVKAAVDGGNAFILTDGGMDYAASPTVRFTYDPTATYDFGGTEEETYVKFPASIKVSTLNWSFFDWWQDYLGDECPEAALAEMSGLPVFGLMIHQRDFDKMVMEDSQLREDIRYAKSSVLLDDYRKFKEFKGWALIHDQRQMRFKAAKVVTEGSVDYLYAKRVTPMRNGTAVTIGNIPEANPEYHNAEYAVGVVFMNEVLQNLIPSPVGNLGGGMVFGAEPGYNGTFKWINEYDRELNPLREVGYFFARFEAFPKPLMYGNQAIAFLYRRCPHVYGTDCDLPPGQLTSAVPLASTAVAADVDTSNGTVTVTLTAPIACEPGDAVTLAGVTGYTSATIAESSASPTYVLAFSPTDTATILSDGAATTAAKFIATTSTVVCA